jgi:hypothetical protein
VVRRRRTIVALLCVVSPLTAGDTPPLRRELPLMGVTGHWTASNDSGPTLTVDGTRWSGTTDSATLARVGAQLFGRVNREFLRNGQSAGAFPIAVATDMPRFSTGTLRVRFNLRGGASDQNAGIVFGLQPDGSYHYVRYNTKDGDLALWAYADGARRNIAHGDSKRQLALGRWHTLDVRLDGTQLTARVPGDSTLSFSYTLPTVPVGRVGVWVKRDAVTSFQAFSADPALSR